MVEERGDHDDSVSGVSVVKAPEGPFHIPCDVPILQCERRCQCSVSSILYIP
jgi:hypothetical protein